MKKHTYSELIAGLKTLDPYLSSIGLKIKPSDRVHQAISQLETVNAALEKPNFAETVRQVDKKGSFLLSHVELAELAEVIKFAKTQDQAIAKSKMIKILNGPLVTARETATNSEARNTVFELSLGSRLSRCGFKAKLKENPDLIATRHGRKYFIQAKRVYSENGIEKNISKAYTQLKRDLDKKDGNHFGIIAISVTRALTDGDKLLEAGSEKSGLIRLDAELKNLIDKYKHCWNRIPERNIVAVILQISCPSFIIEERIYTLATYLTLTNVHPLSGICDGGRNTRIFQTFHNDFISLKHFQ